MSSWKLSTKKQYHTYIKKWFVYGSEMQIDQFQANLENVIEFLPTLFKKWLGHSCINTAKSALSALGLKFDSVLVGQQASSCYSLPSRSFLICVLLDHEKLAFET